MGMNAIVMTISMIDIDCDKREVIVNGGAKLITSNPGEGYMLPILWTSPYARRANVSPTRHINGNFSQRLFRRSNGPFTSAPSFQMLLSMPSQFIES